MIKLLLFPRRFRTIGWFFIAIAFASTIATFVLWQSLRFVPVINMPVIYNGIFFTTAACTPIYIIMALMVIGLLLVGFSREEIEDEYVEHMRVCSLVWAAVVSSIAFVVMDLLFCSISFPYGGSSIFIFFLFLFVVKFRVSMHQVNKGSEIRVKNEE